MLVWDLARSSRLLAIQALRLSLAGEIVAVASFGIRIVRSDGTSPDLDLRERNGTFGEVAGLTRTSSYNEWIRGTINTVPEPGGLTLVPLGAAILIGAKRWQKHHASLH